MPINVPGHWATLVFRLPRPLRATVNFAFLMDTLPRTPSPSEARQRNFLSVKGKSLVRKAVLPLVFAGGLAYTAPEANGEGILIDNVNVTNNGTTTTVGYIATNNSPSISLNRFDSYDWATAFWDNSDIVNQDNYTGIDDFKTKFGFSLDHVGDVKNWQTTLFRAVKTGGPAYSLDSYDYLEVAVPLTSWQNSIFDKDQDGTADGEFGLESGFTELQLSSIGATTFTPGSDFFTGYQAVGDYSGIGPSFAYVPTTVVPEPSTYAIALGAAALAFAAGSRRRRD